MIELLKGLVLKMSILIIYLISEIYRQNNLSFNRNLYNIILYQ